MPDKAVKRFKYLLLQVGIAPYALRHIHPQIRAVYGNLPTNLWPALSDWTS
jgi:hypothetical protein